MAAPGVDGVMVMGGDGLLSRVLMGMYQQLGKQLSIDISNQNTPLPKLPLRIGIIGSMYTPKRVRASVCNRLRNLTLARVVSNIKHNTINTTNRA